jgi:short subunit dehydrogenase-like uncharacterized protein
LCNVVQRYVYDLPSVSGGATNGATTATHPLAAAQRFSKPLRRLVRRCVPHAVTPNPRDGRTRLLSHTLATCTS